MVLLQKILTKDLVEYTMAFFYFSARIIASVADASRTKIIANIDFSKKSRKFSN